MHSDLYLPQVSQAEDANIDPSMLSPFAYAYKRALSTEYPSPTNEKRICLQDHSFELRPERLEYSSPDLPPTPLSPAFPKAIRLQPPPMTPLTVSAPVITHTGMVPTKRVVAMPKKPSKKEPTLILPTTLLSDNGKRSWELFKSLGKGGCGEVYLAKERSDDDSASYVAVKIIKDRKQFQSELNTMKTLNEHRFGRGMRGKELILGYTPKLITALRKKKTLVMEYLAETVAARFDKSGHKFSLKTIVMLALNMMTLVRDFNEKTGQAHVDIKPSNLCTSPNGKDLYLIDFGYSTSPLIKLPGQTGTPLFMACNLQTVGATFPSLLDDFESIGYVIMFFIAGGKKGLPWGGLRTHKDIAAAKNDNSIHEFCTSLNNTEYEPLAQTLATYLYVTRDRTRPFTTLDYSNLYGEWENVLSYCGYANDKIYDWVEHEDSSRTLMNSESHRPKELQQ